MTQKYNVNLTDLLSLRQALATSSAFADRLCVATDADFNQLLSPEELTFCCHKCGNGCNGGYPIKAWERFKKHGLVTGGDYKSGEVSRIFIEKY